MEREREAEMWGAAEVEGQDTEGKPVPRDGVNTPFLRGFELLNKNSGLCIKLQFGKTKLSEGIIILISKKKIKPLQIFPDYSALGDLFLPPSRRHRERLLENSGEPLIRTPRRYTF